MRKMRILTMLLLVCVLVLTLAGCEGKPVEQVEVQKATTFWEIMIDGHKDVDQLTIQGHSTQTNDLLVLEQYDGTEVLVVDNDGALSAAGAVTFEDDVTFTLGADEKVLVDGATTAHTETDGALDINVATITADVSAIDIAITQSDGATSGEDAFGLVMTMTEDDANGDLFGISITAAATTNAAAGSYEAGIVYDCAENTAGACLDGVRLTAGTATGMTDGFDASDADIVNAVNIGVNPILGSNADTLFLGLTDHHLTLTGDEAAAVTFIGADNAGAADTVFDTTGAGTVVVGSADVTAVTIQTDDTGDGSDLVLPAQSVNGSEILNNTVTLTQIANDTITFAEISNSSAVDEDTTFTMADGIELTLQASHTTGDTEVLLFNVDQVNDGTATDDMIVIKIEATSESAQAGDTFTGIGIVWEDGTQGTIMDAGISISNLENTTASMTDAIIVASTHATGVTDGLDVSATGIVNAINIGANLILGDPTNLDALSLGVTNHTLILIGDEDADLTFMGQDNATPADTIFDTFGVGTVVVGSADVTVVTIQTDDTGDSTDLVLPAQAVEAAEILNDTITFAQISNDSAVDEDTKFTLADGIELELEASHTTGDTSVLLIDFDQVDDGAATDDVYIFKIDATSESGDAGDTVFGIGIVWEEGTANTIMDAAIFIDNEETTVSTMSDAILITSSGVNLGVTDGVDVSAANIVNAVNIGSNLILGSNDESLTIGATDSNFIFTVDGTETVTIIGADAASDTNTVFDTTAGGTIALGSADVVGIDLIALTNVDIVTAGGTDFIFKTNEFEVQASSVIDGVGTLVLTVDDTTVATFLDPQAAGSGGDILDITATFGAMNGSDSSIGLDMNLTGADHAGTSNELLGIDLKLTTPDAQTVEVGIMVDDDSWDYAIDAKHIPIISTAAMFMDDFWGDTLAAEWIPGSGTTAGDPDLNQAQFGTLRCTTDAVFTNFADDYAGIDLGLHWHADQHGLVFETRLKLDAVTDVEMCMGMTDTLTDEMMASIAGGAVTVACGDCLVFCFDTDSTTDQWWIIGSAGGTPATTNALAGVAPTNGTYQTFRIEADAGGEDARFYIDNALVGTLTADAVGETTDLTPAVMVRNLGGAARNLDVDYIFVSAQRQVP